MVRVHLPLLRQSISSSCPYMDKSKRVFHLDPSVSFDHFFLGEKKKKTTAEVMNNNKKIISN